MTLNQDDKLLKEDIPKFIEDLQKTVSHLDERVKTLSEENISLKKNTEYIFEKNKLKNFLGEHLYNHLKKHKLIIAGGTITSLFTNNEINDIDVYGRHNDDIYSFAEEFIDDGSWIVSHTKKATQFTYSEKSVQLIHYKHFPTVDELFASFDYTVCMGAFDFKTEEFILHPEFMRHNSQRIIKFNSNTDYPIVSALRVQKYENKGYKISKPEYIRIVMACMALNITSYQELKEHLGGMYGINYDKLFEDVEDEEFDLQVAIDRIANITLSEEYFTVPDPLDVELEEVLEDIDKSIRTCFKHRNKYYRVTNNGSIKEIGKEKDTDKITTIEEAIPFSNLYKFVEKKENQYSSFYKPSFKYVIGEEVKAQEELGSNSWNNSRGKLFFNLRDDIKGSTYYGNKNSTLIEVEFDPKDLCDLETDDSITVTKCRVVREVPEEEWKQWIS